MQLMRKNLGFTLLEVLVVVLLMGIILSFASLKLGDGGQARVLSQEARRVQAVLQLAREEAILQTKEYGVRFQPTGYEFFVLAPPEWKRFSQRDDTLHPRSFPESMEASLELDGESLKLLPSNDKTAKNEKEKNRPQILILSSGEMTPFTLTLRAKTTGSNNDVPLPQYRIIANLLGEIQIKQDDPK
jgi:general secretion pathway protein H